MSAVYVDDFLLAAVENKNKLLQWTARATLHAIHSVFPTPAATGTPDAEDPVSEKKLAKGDARWNTSKEILGYMLNGRDRIIQLPPARADGLLKELKNILKKKRIPLKRFRSITGRLQHSARILPAARAFFTPINNALCGLPDFIGLSCKGGVRLALLNIGGLIRSLSTHPTHVSELVQDQLDYIGYCDASAFGAGRSARVGAHCLADLMAGRHYQQSCLGHKSGRYHHKLRLGDGRRTPTRVGASNHRGPREDAGRPGRHGL
jgi:hypothetical protein